MKIAFYKGRKRIFNRLVSWWTRGPYSHCELVLDDGLSVSASFMDGGMRYKRIEFNPDHWDFIEIGAETPVIRERITKLLTPKPRKYDILGLAGFVFRRISDDKDKMFCSESTLFMIGVYDPWRFDPNTLYAMAKSFYGAEKE